MNLPQQSGLDTVHLQRLFDNMSECYKLFWFQAIVDEVMAGNNEFSFETLINDMIADAWYMVTEYRLNLGPRDTLEALVREVSEITQLKSSEKKEVIIETITECRDKALRQRKQTLTLNVPFRLLSPFSSSFNWDGPKTDLKKQLNSAANGLYEFVGANEIRVRDGWAKYIRDNYEIIKGWVNYNLVSYLQRRNPYVPGIPNKIFPPQERKLGKVIKYWNAVLSVAPMQEIYGGIELESGSVSIDHFVPWSYVAHDELWNLSPTTRSINSQKSNHLPNWDKYFRHLCEVEFAAYETIWKYDGVHKEFEKCQAEHVNSEDVRNKLYRPGISRNEFYANLEEVVRPVYMAAQNLGFDQWVLGV